MKVYLSSTYIDLKGYRESVYRTLCKIEGVQVVAMEDYVACDERPVNKCLNDVERCDAYIGLFAWRYGFIPDGHDLSITNLEYLKAVETNKPTFIFLLDDKATWIDEFRDSPSYNIVNLRKELENRLVVSHFKNKEDLSKEVAVVISNHLNKNDFNMEKKKILILSASPKGVKALNLDTEFCGIYENLRNATNNKKFDIELNSSFNISEIQSVIRKYKPAFVHFSGHGDKNGILCKDDSGNAKLVTLDALAELFGLCRDYVNCVILNACHSEHTAKAISYHIDYVIYMKQAIHYKTAIAFAEGFYSALGDGENIENAFHFGCNRISLDGLNGHDIADLIPPSHKPVITSPDLRAFANCTVFFAEVTDDLYKQRIEVKKYLEQQGIIVLPDKLYNFDDAGSLHNAIDSDLKKSLLFVQLLSEFSPERPIGMTTPVLQFERSKAFTHLPVLQWMDHNLKNKIDTMKIDDKDHLKLLNSPDVVVTDLGDFKQIVIQKLHTILDKNDKNIKSQTSDFDGFVFINADKNVLEDFEIAKEIHKILDDYRMAAFLPMQQYNSQSEERDDYERNMAECEAILVVYYKAQISWLRERLRQCIKARAKRKKENPLKTVVLYDKPIEIPKINHNGSIPDMVVLDCPEPLADNCLPKFLKHIRSEIL